MPLSKTVWPSLNVVIFSSVMHLVLDNTKTLTTQDIIYQIHGLILEESRILAKSIGEQLGISRERIGPIIHEDLDMRKLSAKWVPK
jgi:RNA-binding protein YlmH